MDAGDDGLFFLLLHAWFGSWLYLVGGVIALAWPAIQSIVVTQNHAFLTLGPARAYVIPRQRLIEGDFDSFIAQVRQLHPPSTAGAARAP